MHLRAAKTTTQISIKIEIILNKRTNFLPIFLVFFLIQTEIINLKFYQTKETDKKRKEAIKE